MLQRRRLTISRALSQGGEVRPPKNGKYRDVPLPPDLLTDLEERALFLNDDDFFFASKQGVLLFPSVWHRTWQKVRQEAELNDFCTHELRHAAASWAIQAGANVKVIQRMLGHSSAAMTLDVYGHLFEDGLDDIMQRVQTFRAKPDQDLRKL